MFQTHYVHTQILISEKLDYAFSIFIFIYVLYITYRYISSNNSYRFIFLFIYMCVYTYLQEICVYMKLLNLWWKQ